MWPKNVNGNIIQKINEYSSDSFWNYNTFLNYLPLNGAEELDVPYPVVAEISVIIFLVLNIDEIRGYLS